MALRPRDPSSRLNEIHGTGAIQINCTYDTDVFQKVRGLSVTENASVLEGEPVFSVDRPLFLGCYEDRTAHDGHTLSNVKRWIPSTVQTCRLRPIFSAYNLLRKACNTTEPHQEKDLREKITFIGFARQDVHDKGLGKGSPHLAVRTAGLATVTTDSDVRAGQWMFATAPGFGATQKDKKTLCIISEEHAMESMQEGGLGGPDGFNACLRQCNNTLPCVIGKAMRSASRGDRVDVKLCHSLSLRHYSEKEEAR